MIFFDLLLCVHDSRVILRSVIVSEDSDCQIEDLKEVLYFIIQFFILSPMQWQCPSQFSNNLAGIVYRINSIYNMV